MTEREIDVLNKACQMSGIDPSTISAENPATKQGKIAQLLMAAAGEIDPVQAAMWRKAAPGGGFSIATLGEMQSGQQLSNRAKQELWEKDPEFVVARIKQREQQFEADKKWLEDGAAASRLRNKMREVGGNEDRAREAIAREDAAEKARKEQQLASAKHAQEMEQRLQQQRVQSANLAGRFIN